MSSAPAMAFAANRQAAVEGTARVVGVGDGVIWLEPEQSGSCQGCAGAAACADKGIGTLANRLAARRFSLALSGSAAKDSAAGRPEGGPPGVLAPGDRVVVAVGETALVKAALTAYAIPLFALLAAGGLAQALTGDDAIAMASCAAGLAVGLVLARVVATRLAEAGETTPRLVRRLTAPAAPAAPATTNCPHSPSA